MTSIPLTPARADLNDLIDQSKQGKKAFISQRGQTRAVLMSVPEYQKLNGEHLAMADKLKVWREQFSHELIAAIDDFSPERE